MLSMVDSLVKALSWMFTFMNARKSLRQFIRSFHQPAAIGAA